MLLSDFHCKVNEGTIQFPGRTHTPRTLGSLFVESSMSWVYRYDPETKLFCQFPYNENLTTLPHSNAGCHQLTLLTGRKNFIRAQSCLMQVCFFEIHQVFAKNQMVKNEPNIHTHVKLNTLSCLICFVIYTTGQLRNYNEDEITRKIGIFK